MKTVPTNEAKTRLSALLQEVSRGETIIIARGRHPVAKLVPFAGTSLPRPKVGEVIDKGMRVPERALRALDAGELKGWGL